MILIRRVKMDDSVNRMDKKWVLFEQGKIGWPLAILEDMEAEALMLSIQEQLRSK